MIRKIEGVYRNGKIELFDVPDDIYEEMKVVVSYEPKARLDLASLGITKEEAALMRAQMESFIEDWEDPSMDVYDDYDATKANL